MCTWGGSASQDSPPCLPLHHPSGRCSPPLPPCRRRHSGTLTSSQARLCTAPHHHRLHPPPAHPPRVVWPGVVGGAAVRRAAQQLKVDHVGGACRCREQRGGAAGRVQQGSGRRPGKWNGGAACPQTRECREGTQGHSCARVQARRDARTQSPRLPPAHPPWRTDVPMQSVPVSPPPMTTTVLPCSATRGSSEAADER